MNTSEPLWRNSNALHEVTFNVVVVHCIVWITRWLTLVGACALVALANPLLAFRLFLRVCCHSFSCFQCVLAWKCCKWQFGPYFAWFLGIPVECPAGFLLCFCTSWICGCLVCCFSVETLATSCSDNVGRNHTISKIFWLISVLFRGSVDFTFSNRDVSILCYDELTF